MLRGLDKLKYLDLSLSDLVLHAFTFLWHLKDNYFETQQRELVTNTTLNLVELLTILDVTLLIWSIFCNKYFLAFF